MTLCYKHYVTNKFQFKNRFYCKFVRLKTIVDNISWKLLFFDSVRSIFYIYEYSSIISLLVSYNNFFDLFYWDITVFPFIGI